MNPVRRQRLLINCSNLHVGGAVAVASSFINILSQQDHPQLEISLLLSSAVHANLVSLGTQLSPFAHWEVKDYVGLSSLWQGLGSHFARHDVIFTVFGPAYAFVKGRHHVCGFAQPLIVYPSNPVERQMNVLDRIVQRLKYKVHEVFFARADELIVELEHVKRALVRKYLFRATPIHVVYNTADLVFQEPARWMPVTIPQMPMAIRLGVVSRNYIHKNLACLPDLKRTLLQRHGLKAEFFVTFTDAEWQACNDDFRRTINNVGSLMLPQCPSFYSAMDGIIFPSLLECFSAVPLETMTMCKPLFASDLPFIRDCCQENANYFDPLDVESMATTIAHYFQDTPLDTRRRQLEDARKFVQRFPSPEQRARSYLDIAMADVRTTAE